MRESGLPTPADATKTNDLVRRAAPLPDPTPVIRHQADRVHELLVPDKRTTPAPSTSLPDSSADAPRVLVTTTRDDVENVLGPLDLFLKPTVFATSRPTDVPSATPRALAPVPREIIAEAFHTGDVSPIEDALVVPQASAEPPSQPTSQRRSSEVAPVVRDQAPAATGPKSATKAVAAAKGEKPSPDKVTANVEGDTPRRNRTPAELKALENTIVSRLKADPEVFRTEIARELEVSPSYFSRIEERLRTEGRFDEPVEQPESFLPATKAKEQAADTDNLPLETEEAQTLNRADVVNKAVRAQGGKSSDGLLSTATYYDGPNLRVEETSGTIAINGVLFPRNILETLTPPAAEELVTGDLIYMAARQRWIDGQNQNHDAATQTVSYFVERVVTQMGGKSSDGPLDTTSYYDGPNLRVEETSGTIAINGVLFPKRLLMRFSPQAMEHLLSLDFQQMAARQVWLENHTPPRKK